jgi:hypothetical protein
VRNKGHLEGSIAEGYISEECLTFCSRFFNIDTKLNRVDRHASTAMTEPPAGLSIFNEIDYKRRGQNLHVFDGYEIQKMKQYILSNYDEVNYLVE